MHDCSQHLNHKKHKEPENTKGPNRHRVLQGLRKPYREHKKYYSIKLLLDQCFSCCVFALNVLRLYIKTIVNIIRNLEDKSLALVWKQ